MDTARHKQIPSSEAQSAGRVVIDSRGRNVWQWNDDQLDSTTIMLKRLDNAELALESTRKVRRPEPVRGARPRAGKSRAGCRDDANTLEELRIEQTFNVKLGSGFDPYNRS
jgi:hypothetical protein